MNHYSDTLNKDRKSNNIHISPEQGSPEPNKIQVENE